MPRRLRVRLTAVASLSLLVTLCFSPFVAARDFPPEVPPPKPYVMPAPALRVLPNGLKVVVIERHSLPLVTLRLVVKAGAESDPANLEGTAQFTASVLPEGTERRSALQIAEAVDSAGGMLDTGAEWDSSYASLSVLRDHEELAFDLLADIVIRPAFSPEEVERMRKQTLSALDVARDDPAYVADTTLRRILLAGTAYGHPEDGVPASVLRLTAQDLCAFHRAHYRPDNSILAVVGDLSAAEAFEQTARYFGDWKPLPPASAGTPAGAQPPSGRVVVIDKPDAVQTEIRIGEMGVRQSSDEFYALSVANQIIGGPAENRLFKALRSQQGLTYGASSDLVCLQTLGTWVAKTFTRTTGTVKAVHLALEQMKNLRDHSLDDRDLETAKSYLIGHLALEFETSEDTASKVVELMIHNLPLDYWNRFPEKIRAVTPQQVAEVARKYLDPDRSVVILVGNYSGFGKDAKKLGAETVIALDDVDFGSPSLERKPRTAGKP